MNWNIVLQKGLSGLVTVVVSVLVSLIPQIEAYVGNVVPENLSQLTIVGFVGFALNALANWLKHKAD